MTEDHSILQPARPSRIPSRAFNPSIEGLRGLAVIMVVLSHALALEGFTIGVDIFFVISGYLITGILSEELRSTGRIVLGQFYLRRAFRLFPALWLFLTVVMIWTYFRASATGVSMVHATGLSSLLYVENWHILAVGQVGNQQFPMDPAAHTWSLSIEEQFYLAWPLVLLLVWRWKGPTAALVVAVTGTLASIGDCFLLARIGTTVGRVYFASDTRACQLMAGCSVALLAQRGLIPRLARWVAPAALCVLLAVGLLSLPLLYQTTITPLVGGFLVAALSQNPVRPLSSRIGQWLGRRSYAIYLWHPFIGTALYYEFHLPRSFGLLACVLAITLIVSDITFRNVEAPLRALGRRWAGARRVVAATSTA